MLLILGKYDRKRSAFCLLTNIIITGMIKKTLSNVPVSCSNTKEVAGTIMDGDLIILMLIDINIAY